MADPTARCNDVCGCPTPCPGGVDCRCATAGDSGGLAPPEMVSHVYCQCGDHCSCNPCGCMKTSTGGVGRAFCSCAPGCTCDKCSA